MEKNDDLNQNFDEELVNNSNLENNVNLLEEEFASKTAPKENPKWYVIHTYSGYENNVKANIEKIIENRQMYDVITEVVVPIQKGYELTKSGKKKEIQRKIFPGYVFLKMIMNDDTWYVVRNTRGVTSFVGPGSKPVPLTEDEVMSMGIETFINTCDIEIGDVVLIKEGPFAKSSGVVKEVNISKKVVIVNVNFFGRETPVELGFHQVQQMG
ncbi:transcription termination/antitermination protein NusG [uncultured Tyzzerella sp.]|uniref:transcription termination/antitermination protein NusG n=1 Tax=uncultured Tyzzerella sp. TaxID=2321398 RepID=UPI0029423A53|nr:transcription termination/antitermination protein NusG [uncultured Tyzzerella sp.]